MVRKEGGVGREEGGVGWEEGMVGRLEDPTRDPTRAQHLSEAMVSSALEAAGETLQSMTVTELPPREPLSSRVNFESRKGTCEPKGQQVQERYVRA